MEANEYTTASLIVQLGNAVTYYRNLRMEKLGLTSVQSDAIRLILHHPGITAVQLKYRLGLSQSTIAGILARLELKGLIEKRPDTQDGRRIFLIPSQRGLKLEEDLKETALQTQKLITKGMSDDQKECFNQLLQMALDQMNAVRYGEPERRNLHG